MWTSMEISAAFQQEEVAPDFKLTHHVVAKRSVHEKYLVI